MIWSYTNLGDYYGHAGRIGDSYRYYLKSLALERANAHAKKGIAWIVFSHEKNPVEALRILDSVTKNYQAPDYYLLKAEIAEYMGNHKERNYNLDQYFVRVENPDYGDMYNAHNVAFYLEQAMQYDRALELAKKEVDNRPTTQSYDLLAYSLYKTGEINRAESIVNDHIVGKTSEPAILLHVAEIFKASGNAEKAGEIKTELMGSLYELGPSRTERIRNL
jgi:tetratricopeptide (TPR) repeat protein